MVTTENLSPTAGLIAGRLAGRLHVDSSVYSSLLERTQLPLQFHLTSPDLHISIFPSSPVAESPS